MNCTLPCFYSFYLFGNANMVRIKRHLINTVIINKIMKKEQVRLLETGWYKAHSLLQVILQVMEILPGLTGTNKHLG